MKIMCSIYRSKRKDGMYLYVPRKKDMSELPEPLMQFFGTPELAMDLVLTPERTLAREDITTVLRNLEAQGYHLQMPPQADDYVQHLPDELLYRNDPI